MCPQGEIYATTNRWETLGTAMMGLRLSQINILPMMTMICRVIAEVLIKWTATGFHLIVQNHQNVSMEMGGTIMTEAGGMIMLLLLIGDDDYHHDSEDRYDDRKRHDRDNSIRGGRSCNM